MGSSAAARGGVGGAVGGGGLEGGETGFELITFERCAHCCAPVHTAYIPKADLSQ